MNCAEYEQRIALYVEGDLALEEAATVERHLAECSRCESFAAEIRESQSALKVLASAVPDPMVRRRVLATLESRRSPMRWLAVAAAALLVVTAGLLWSLRPQSQRLPEQATVKPAPPITATERKEPESVRQVARKRKPRASKFKTEPALLARNTEPLVVKMFTDDPDVVIIWLVDGKGKNNEEAPFGFDSALGE